MSLLVVGSVALDSIETPFGKVDETLGGSATHFALAASLLAETRLVGNIGHDLLDEHLQLLRDRNVDVTGLKLRDGKSFRWSGRYLEDMNVRETIKVELNVFGDYEPEIPPAYRDSEFVFLANGSPVHQLQVLDEMENPRFSVVDTMDHWIESQRDELRLLLKKVDAIVLNDSEARQLSGEYGAKAAEAVLDLGPKYVIMKKGEHGAIMVGQHQRFLIPAYPTTNVADPTGAGDSFAGGMMGHLAREGEVTPATLRTAMAYGTVIASFNCEDFGVKRVANLTIEDVESRLAEFREMLMF